MFDEERRLKAVQDIFKDDVIAHVHNERFGFTFCLLKACTLTGTQDIVAIHKSGMTSNFYAKSDVTDTAWMELPSSPNQVMHLRGKMMQCRIGEPRINLDEVDMTQAQLLG